MGTANPTDPPTIVGPLPSVAGAGPQLGDSDKARRCLGIASYVVGIVVFVVVMGWAICTLDRALVSLTDPKFSMSPWAAALYGAKAVLVLTGVSFSIALIRTAERLTMPLPYFIQLVEYESGRKSSRNNAQLVLDLMRQLQDLLQSSKGLADAVAPSSDPSK